MVVENLAESLYYGYATGHPYRTPSLPRQIRESLTRSRHHGMEFELAWRIATRHLSHAHDREDRHQWQELLGDDEYRSWWEAAYNGDRGHRLLNASELLRLALEDAAERDRRILRRTGRAPQGLRAAD